MRILIVALVFLSSVLAYSSKKDEASFNKVKSLYIGHLQKKIIVMGEMSGCMAEGKSFKDLKTCSKVGKAKIAKLDKIAHEAHLRAKKKKEKK